MQYNRRPLDTGATLPCNRALVGNLVASPDYYLLIAVEESCYNSASFTHPVEGDWDNRIGPLSIIEGEPPMMTVASRKLRSGAGAVLLLLVGNSVGTSQGTPGNTGTSKTSRSESDKPIFVKDLKVLLPAYSAPKPNTTCDEKLSQGLCQSRIRESDLWRQGYIEFKTGDTLLGLRDYQGAKEHCLVALRATKRLPSADTSSQPQWIASASDHSKDPEECVRKAEGAQDDNDLRAMESMVSLQNLNLRTGDIERAKAEQDELRKQYSSLASSSVQARSFAEQHLKSNWSTVLAWFSSKLSLVFLISLAVLWLYLLLVFYRSLRNSLRRGVLGQSTRWFVQSIKDDQNQSAAGAVMDALSISGNALLRKPFAPPALLLIPPGFGGPDGDGIWWSFFGALRPSFDIEKLPRREIERHRFVLQSELEEVNLKIAGSELSGLVSVVRNISRWFNKGLPAVQGAVLKRERQGQNASWAVRLNATSAFKWAKWLQEERDNDERRQENRRGPQQCLTISVYASTEEQEFVDAIGLAAQRAAFKLFYRLAKPDKDADEITAIAAFHQGVVLLRGYL